MGTPEVLSQTLSRHKSRYSSSYDQSHEPILVPSDVSPSGTPVVFADCFPALLPTVLEPRRNYEFAPHPASLLPSRPTFIRPVVHKRRRLATSLRKTPHRFRMRRAKRSCTALRDAFRTARMCIALKISYQYTRALLEWKWKWKNLLRCRVRAFLQKRKKKTRGTSTVELGKLVRLANHSEQKN